MSDAVFDVCVWRALLSKTSAALGRNVCVKIVQLNVCWLVWQAISLFVSNRRFLYRISYLRIVNWVKKQELKRCSGANICKGVFWAGSQITPLSNLSVLCLCVCRDPPCAARIFMSPRFFFPVVLSIHTHRVNSYVISTHKTLTQYT